MALNSRAAPAFATGGGNEVEQVVFLLRPYLLCLAAFPAIPPVHDQEFEAKRVNLHARLETDTQISEVHLVLVGVGE